MEYQAITVGRGAIATGPLEATRVVSPFFPFMAALLLAVNLVGFAPTFFLRPLFGGSPLPLRTHVHGALFTSWFVLLLVQAVLASRRRLKLHRVLGLAAAALAALMVVSGLVTLYYGVGDFVAEGGTVPRASQFLWANLMLLVAFLGFVVLGFRRRFDRDAHMRLMLLASLSMISQSIARISDFRVFQAAGIGEAGSALFTLGGLVALLLAVVLHDVIARRRVHRVSAWGVPGLLAAFFAGVFVIPSLGAGQALVRFLY